MNTTDLGAATTPPDIPVSRETWYCPSCGKEAPALIGRIRMVICRPCGWMFEVRLLARPGGLSDEWFAQQLGSYDGIELPGRRT